MSIVLGVTMIFCQTFYLRQERLLAQRGLPPDGWSSHPEKNHTIQYLKPIIQYFKNIQYIKYRCFSVFCTGLSFFQKISVEYLPKFQGFNPTFQEGYNEVQKGSMKILSSYRFKDPFIRVERVMLKWIVLFNILKTVRQKKRQAGLLFQKTRSELLGISNKVAAFSLKL